jgi:hypothetical protein
MRLRTLGLTALIALALVFPLRGGAGKAHPFKGGRR